MSNPIKRGCCVGFVRDVRDCCPLNWDPPPARSKQIKVIAFCSAMSLLAFVSFGVASGLLPRNSTRYPDVDPTEDTLAVIQFAMGFFAAFTLLNVCCGFCRLADDHLVLSHGDPESRGDKLSQENPFANNKMSIPFTDFKDESSTLIQDS